MTGPTHQRGKDMKKPVLRTLSAQLQLSRDAEPAPILLHIVDMGLGLDRHSVTMARQDGGAIPLTGILSGVTFHPQERRGAPRKIARDMALYIAWHVFASGGQSTAKARKKVLEMWSGNNWPGVPDEAALGKKLQAASDEWSRKRLAFLVGEFGDASENFYVAARDAMPCQNGQITGDGWFWPYGTERAIFGKFLFDGPLQALR